MLDTIKELLTSFLLGIFQAGYSCWNTVTDKSLELFTTSLNSSPLYQTAYNLYSLIADISLPIAIVFFLIAIIRETTATPPDQQIRKFVGELIKFGVMVGILANLWDIMGFIVQIADGIANRLGTGSSIQYDIPGRLSNGITAAVDLLQDPSLFNIMDFFLGCIGFFVCFLVFLVGGIICTAVFLASSLSILSCAFQRIIKPMVLLPFSCITVAFASGTGDASRIAASYLKAFFGFCISGAFMVLCIRLGGDLSNNLIVLPSISTGVAVIDSVLDSIFLVIEMTIAPIIISGLVQSSESMLNKFL